MTVFYNLAFLKCCIWCVEGVVFHFGYRRYIRRFPSFFLTSVAWQYMSFSRSRICKIFNLLGFPFDSFVWLPFIPVLRYSLLLPNLFLVYFLILCSIWFVSFVNLISFHGFKFIQTFLTLKDAQSEMDSE